MLPSRNTFDSNMSGRTCAKCRLHGHIEPLKGHKRVCAFANCTCSRCASHEYILAHKNSARSDKKVDKGRIYRQSLQLRSSTATQSKVPFPEMSENMQSLPTMVKDKLDSRKLALELADYEDAKTQAEKRKGELGFLYFAYYFII